MHLLSDHLFRAHPDDTALSGKCYAAGDLCNIADHRRSGTTADGEPIRCEDSGGRVWQPSF